MPAGTLPVDGPVEGRDAVEVPVGFVATGALPVEGSSLGAPTHAPSNIANAAALTPLRVSITSIILIR